MIQPGSVQIRYLADHPEVLSSLAAGFKAQWPKHFDGQSLEDIKLGFANSCRESGLPLSLVALIDQTFTGTASLRADGTVRSDLGPWLAHLFVQPGFRNRGVATELVRAVEQEAVRHGFTTLYAATARAARIFERLGWRLVDVVEHRRERVNVLMRNLLSGESH